MEGNRRAALGLAVAGAGVVLIVMFHLGARGIINRGLQASLEVVSLAGLLAAAYGLWTLRPGGVRRVAYALVLPAVAATAFLAYLWASFPLGFFLAEPLNLVAGPLVVAGWWVAVLGAWRWSQDEDDTAAVQRARIGLALVVAGGTLSLGADLAQGFTGMVHASAMVLGGFVAAAAYLHPLAPAAPQPRAAAKAAAARP